MFLNRRKDIKEDAVDLFSRDNFGFNTNLNRKAGIEDNNKKESKKEDSENSWAQWWKLGEDNKDKVIWKTKDKIIIGVEVALIVYFTLWRLGLVPIF